MRVQMAWRRENESLNSPTKCERKGENNGGQFKDAKESGQFGGFEHCKMGRERGCSVRRYWPVNSVLGWENGQFCRECMKLECQKRD